MNLFSSRKKGWLVTTWYVAVIYLTLAPVGSLQLWLRSRGMQTSVSELILLFIIMITLYVVVIRLKRRSLMNLLTLTACGGMYAYIATVFAPSPSDKIHIIEYSILASLLYYALKFDVKGKSGYVIAWTLTTVIGLVDELIQSRLPTRAYDLNDLMINSLAAACALLVVGLVVEDGR